MIVTSPPYTDQRKKTYGGIPPDEYVSWFMPRAAEFHRVLKSDGSFILNIKEKVEDGERLTYVIELILAMRRAGWLWTEEYIWHKKNTTPGKWPNRFRDAWERCIHFTKTKIFKMFQDAVKVPAAEATTERGKHLNDNDRVRIESGTRSGYGRKIENCINEMVLPSNVLHLASECANVGHSAAFPVALPEFFIRLFTGPGDLVLDPFIGSGTTAIACIQEGRHYLGVEIRAENVATAEKRIAGARAKLDGPRPDPKTATLDAFWKVEA